MSIIALILVIVAIFVGHKAGLTIYAIGTAVLWILGGVTLTYLRSPHVLPIVVLSLLVTGAAIMVSRWWGLLLFIVGHIAVTTLFGLGLL